MKKKTTKKRWICNKLDTCQYPDCKWHKPHRKVESCDLVCSADPAGYATCRPMEKGEEIIYGY